MTSPIILTVKRYRCPHCNRSHSSNSRAVGHMARCWFNPAAHGCKTCIHFRPEADACGCEPGCNWGNSGHSLPESCAVGVDLTGDGAEVKPGPITGCPKWAPSPNLPERG